MSARFYGNLSRSCEATGMKPFQKSYLLYIKPNRSTVSYSSQRNDQITIFEKKLKKIFSLRFL